MTPHAVLVNEYYHNIICKDCAMLSENSLLFYVRKDCVFLRFSPAKKDGPVQLDRVLEVSRFKVTFLKLRWKSPRA